eukprot:CAMPEP_0113559316 /NCGR_PEP_ID=MMETSP0015_2-20120614/18831_1 /TAXON_ID=2838 /ORGANISM="Odontella" /LENGTH=187 /DNA_ID=CAMNT_0000460943 /DNA_START=67 /DNA_END=630 /DNA_ORIENTATION=+ /assembly_acc=CAM_ASM_000160
MMSSFILPSLRQLKNPSHFALSPGRCLVSYAGRAPRNGYVPSSCLVSAGSTHTISEWNGPTSLVPISPACVDMQIRQRSNRSRRGLYDGKDIRSGNNVSFSNKKTKRKFKPNVFKKSVYSETLDEKIRFHITTSALRSIDKFGGLDNYLLKSKHVASGEGLAAKKRILQQMWLNKKRETETNVAESQ